MKFDNDTVIRWTEMAANYLGQRGHDLSEVKQGVDAWTIAHQTGITREAYEDRSVTDAHIQTALEKVFPDVTFKDKKVY